MADEQTLTALLKSMGTKLNERRGIERLLSRYYEGRTPLPDVIVRAKVTRAYNMLLGQATAPWGSIVVDSVQDRLEITGIKSDDKAADDAIWGIYQENKCDAESKLVHNNSLVSGRAFGSVWPNDNGDPEISFDSASQMIVKYIEGSRRRRVAAMRYWFDDDTNTPNVNLYLADGIYKFVGPKDNAGPADVEWSRRDVPDEPWPVPNPFGVVPVVEFPVNRRLKEGPWAWARGEFEHVLPVLDRINLLTFLGLVVAFWMGFPVRGVIGDRIMRDDEGNALPPFNVGADQVVQLENPDAKFAEFQAADRRLLSIYDELSQLAALTKTPLTYFPSGSGISNISADTIRALEGGLVAKVPPHKATLGEGWEELLRIGGMMLEKPVLLSPRAELQWTDHESRSLAERADAASKLSAILPQTALLEYVLNLTEDQIARYKQEQANDVMGQLLAAATQPAIPGAPVPALPVPAPTNNGAGG